MITRGHSLWRIPDVADYLGVSAWWVRVAVRKGRLPTLPRKKHGRVWFDPKVVVRFIHENLPKLQSFSRTQLRPWSDGFPKSFYEPQK